jgi:hypothetical protein
MIVSRGPPLASEPPPVPPSLPNAAARLLALKGGNDGQPGSPVTGSSSMTVVPPGSRMDDAALLSTSLSAPSLSQPGHNPSEDRKDLWGYLQQFLVRHKGPVPPDKGWVGELITLPRVRDLEWNVMRQAQHPFQDSKERDVSAMILQLTGEPAPQPCTRCMSGKGPFKGCIMIAREAHLQPLRTVISCANCFYHYNQT